MPLYWNNVPKTQDKYIAMQRNMIYLNIESTSISWDKTQENLLWGGWCNWQNNTNYRNDKTGKRNIQRRVTSISTPSLTFIMIMKGNYQKIIWEDLKHQKLEHQHIFKIVYRQWLYYQDLPNHNDILVTEELMWLTHCF